MNTIIEKIRAEVERLKEKYTNMMPSIQKCSVCDELLAKLSDLEKEEKPMNQEGLEEEITEFIANHYEVDYYDGLQHHGEYLDTYDVEEIARHFAQWGAEHRGSSEIPNDLESYAQKVEDYYDVGEERGYLCTHRGDIKNAVLAGAKWQKEQMTKELSEKIASAYQLGLADKEKQMMDEWLKDRDGCFWDGVEEGKKAMREKMMKEAVEGYLVSNGLNNLQVKTANLGDRGYYQGDKVRIIIVKED